MAMSLTSAQGHAVGAFGSDYVDDTSTHATDLNYENTDGTPAGYLYHTGFPYWTIIEAKTDAVFTSITYHPDHKGDVWDVSDTLSAGSFIHAKITEFDLTSGTVLATR